MAAVFVADILFLILIGALVFVERRLARLEITVFERAADCDEKLFCFAAALEELKKRRVEETDDVGESEKRRLQAAERRFSEGIASILGYEYKAPFPIAADILGETEVQNDR